MNHPVQHVNEQKSLFNKFWWNSFDSISSDVPDKIIMLLSIDSGFNS